MSKKDQKFISVNDFTLGRFFSGLRSVMKHIHLLPCFSLSFGLGLWIKTRSVVGRFEGDGNAKSRS